MISVNSILKTSGYELHPTENVWKKSDYESIAYSDGDETETRIIQVIQNAEDLTSLSDELEAHCLDWPSTYHLSKRRGNLVRPFLNNISEKQILEIGSGMGAITRVLGESGANVIALEGTSRRAHATRLRTRDLGNVNVIAENFNDVDLDLKFDVITLIGVLEYANLYSNSSKPQEDLLRKCFNMLNPDGFLLIAIENKLGIKYFAGAPEDHVGIPMYGLENRYTSNSVRTFGKYELNELLNLTGFKTNNFHVPLPDYKLTTSVILEQGFEHPLFDSAALIRDSFTSDPQLPSTLSFVPELVLQSLEGNKLNQELANSFLIVANKGNFKLSEDHALAYHYSTRRKKEFCKYIIFEASTDGIDVESIKMSVGKQTSPLKHLDLRRARYGNGKILKDEIFEILSQEYWSHSDLQNIYSNYLSYLKSLVPAEGKIDVLMLPGKYIDLLPRNIYLTDDGEFNFFDQEWEAPGFVDIRQILFRSILSISNVSILGADEHGVVHTLETLANLIFRLIDLSVTAEDIELFLQIETAYQQQVSGSNLTCHDMRQHFIGKIGRNRFKPNQSFVDIAERDSAVAERDSAVAERDSAVAERDSAVAERDSAVAERDSAVAERDSAVAERDSAVAERDSAVAERDSAVAERDSAVAERDSAVAERDSAVAERDSAVAERDSAVAERDSAVAERDSAVAERDSAVAERDSAVAERDSVLNSTIWKLFKPYRKLRNIFIS